MAVYRLRIKRWRFYQRGDEVPEELAQRYPHLVEAEATGQDKPAPPVETTAPKKQQQEEAN